MQKNFKDSTMSVTVDYMSENKTNTLRFPILLPWPKILTSNHPHSLLHLK